MMVTLEYDEAMSIKRLVAEWTDDDLACINFDKLDTAVLASPISQPADMFLYLEIIFRRAKEQGVLK